MYKNIHISQELRINRSYILVCEWNPAARSTYFTNRIRSPRFLHGCPRTDDWPCQLTMTPNRAVFSRFTRHSRACERPQAYACSIDDSKGARSTRNFTDTALRENVSSSFMDQYVPNFEQILYFFSFPSMYVQLYYLYKSYYISISKESGRKINKFNSQF